MSDTSSYLRENPFGHSEFLVGKAKGGSQRAWEAIYARYRKMLLTHLQARITGFARRRMDAEDMLQKAMAKAWEKIDAFEYRGENSFRQWLRTLVIHTVQNELRAHELERCSTADSDVQFDEMLPSGHQEEHRKSEANSAVLEALGQLDELDRDILIQRNFEELSFDEIAAILQCPRENARTAYTRALDRLQRQLKR